MATQALKKIREAKLTELYLNHTPAQIKEFYLNGKMYELMGLAPKTLTVRTFERDFDAVIKRLSESHRQQLTTEDFQAKIERWQRRLENEIDAAKSANQIGVISNYLDKLMKLDGVSLDGIKTAGSDTYIFQNNCFVSNQPEKIADASVELAAWTEANKNEDN